MIKKLLSERETEMKIISKTLILLSLFLVASCFENGHFKGFYEPAEISITVPNGPPEYRAGWYAGCRSGLSMKHHANSFVYNVNFGNGVYTQMPAFQSGWGQGWFACVTTAAGASPSYSGSYGFGPLEK